MLKTNVSRRSWDLRACSDESEEVAMQPFVIFLQVSAALSFGVFDCMSDVLG